MGLFSEALPFQVGTTTDHSALTTAALKVETTKLARTFESSETVTIIHLSRLFRDCLRRSLAASSFGMLFDYPSVDTWLQSGHDCSNSVILIGLCGSSLAEDERQLELLLSRAVGASVVATSDIEDPAFILDLLSKGVRGYIPSSLALDVSIGALQIVRAGGIYVPANCLLAMPRHPAANSAKESGLEMFTAKQLAVIDAIRQGKANKTIAYELNMCESTVKVHVRNIMKKMTATNRTQVAFIANKILAEKQKDTAYSPQAALR